MDSPVATSDLRVTKAFADAAVDPDSTKRGFAFACATRTAHRFRTPK
jgi:hypothetical protein